MIHFVFKYVMESLDRSQEILRKDIYAKTIEDAKMEFNRQICSDKNVQIIEIIPVESL